MCSMRMYAHKSKKYNKYIEIQYFDVKNFPQNEISQYFQNITQH